MDNRSCKRCRIYLSGKSTSTDKLYDRVVFGEVLESDELELAKPEPQPSPIAEKLEDVSTNEQIRQKSGRVELDEDFERERFRLLNLQRKRLSGNPRFLLPVTPKMHQTKRVWGEKKLLAERKLKISPQSYLKVFGAQL